MLCGEVTLDLFWMFCFSFGLLRALFVVLLMVLPAIMCIESFFILAPLATLIMLITVLRFYAYFVCA